MQGLLPSETSRFDVVGAYMIVADHYHSGKCSIGYLKLCKAMKRLRGNLDGLYRDEGIRQHAAALLWKRRREIRREW